MSASYVVKAEIDEAYDSYDFKLTGFETEAQKADRVSAFFLCVQVQP